MTEPEYSLILVSELLLKGAMNRPIIKQKVNSLIYY